MALAFATSEDRPDGVVIADVGMVGAKGEDPVAVADAALVMRELQDPEGKPLEGDELREAAKAFAERTDLVVKNVKAADLEDEEVGVADPHETAALTADAAPETTDKKENRK